MEQQLTAGIAFDLLDRAVHQTADHATQAMRILDEHRHDPVVSLYYEMAHQMMSDVSAIHRAFEVIQMCAEKRKSPPVP